MASELASNAITHSESGRPGGTFIVRLHHGPGYIRAAVQDQGSAWGGDLAVSARNPHGLYLIAALAAGYGSAAGPGRSRVVWAYHQGWSVFWDKKYRVWRASPRTTPDSVLYAEDPDLDAVISYITAHA